MTFDQVVETLPHLNRTQLIALDAKIAFLLKNTSDDRDQHQRVYELVREVVKSLTKRDAIPFTAFRKTADGRAFAEHAQAFEEYVRTEICRKSPRSFTRCARICITAIARSLEAGNVPITAATLCKNLSRVDRIIETQFPGYRGAGLLSVLTLATPRFVLRRDHLGDPVV